MNVAYVVTTINSPNDVLKSIATGCQTSNAQFFIVGDTKTPKGFHVTGSTYLDIDAQLASGFRYALHCPTGHYVRKNIGYLEAARRGAEVIRETDDDNYPRAGFFQQPNMVAPARVIEGRGWVNAYRFFTDKLIWPRGLPLDEVHAPMPVLGEALQEVAAPIQQGLADQNPDVDAIFRLVCELPVTFDDAASIALRGDSWCPFNSQNTTFFRPAFPLLYLPAHCSFRMTDIWRSFVAIRVLQAHGWPLLFHSATVWQDRNAHNLLRDFEDEIPGYRRNREIADILRATVLDDDHHVAADMRTCYQALVKYGIFPTEELKLLDMWLSDLGSEA